MSNSYLISNKVLWLASGLDLTNKISGTCFRKLKNFINQKIKIVSKIILLVQSVEEIQFILKKF